MGPALVPPELLAPAKPVAPPPPHAPPEPAAPEVYKASFTSSAVYEIDFDDADRNSLDGLRERSVNQNLTLEDSGPA